MDWALQPEAGGRDWKWTWGSSEVACSRTGLDWRLTPRLKTVLRLSEYGGDDEGSWVLLESVEG